MCRAKPQPEKQIYSSRQGIQHPATVGLPSQLVYSREHIKFTERLSEQGDTHPVGAACVQSAAQADADDRRFAAARPDVQLNAGTAASLPQPSSASDEQLAALKQQHAADKQRLEAEAASLGSRLAAAEASLTKAQQRETSLRESIVKHSTDMQQGAQRCAELQV